MLLHLGIQCVAPECDRNGLFANLSGYSWFYLDMAGKLIRANSHIMYIR